MPRRSFSVVLPTIVALGVAGASAGTGLGALPPPPTVTVPTVTLPLPPPPPLPVPVPLPPPPAVTVPPKVETPPVSTPPAPVDPPVAVSPAAAPPSVPPGLRGGGASSVYYTRHTRRSSIRRAQVAKPAKRRNAAPVKKRDAFVRAASPARAVKQAKGVKGASASVQGPVPEDAGFGFFGPVGSALRTLDIPRGVIPPALFAMAALAILLLTLASAPLPARTSRTGAMMVHMRGSIAVAGTAALMMAVATYFLL